MRLRLREYQEKSLEALQREIRAEKNALCVLPTGGGKSLVLAALIRAYSPEKVLVLAHVKELLVQDALALHRLAPEIEQGFFVAGLGEKNARAQVVFGSVQSVYRNLALFQQRRSLLLVDEAHLCPRKAEAMYGEVFSHFASARRIGFTATPERLDSGSLIEGDSAWFDCIAVQVEPKQLISQGFLVPLAGVLTEKQASLEGVAMRGGEFVAEQAEQAVMRSLSLKEAVESAKEYAKGRRSWLVFAAGVEHSKEVLKELQAQGVSSRAVTSEDSSEFREESLDQFRSGEFRALVNVGILTTGFDAPLVDCIVSLRPTQSRVLWQQMLGRGMRVADRKKDCLLLDFVGNLDRLGGVGVVQSVKDFRALAPVNPLRKKPRKRALEGREDPALQSASTVDPMTSGRSFEAAVRKCSFFTVPSKKYPGKQLVIGVYELEDEFGRAVSARAFLCVEYGGGAREHAVRWFARRGVAPGQVPHRALDALRFARVMPKPDLVLTRYDRGLQCFVIEREHFESFEAQKDPSAAA